MTLRPIDRLLMAVADAIVTYDGCDDHIIGHDGDDCYRCRLAAILPPVYAPKAPVKAKPKKWTFLHRPKGGHGYWKRDDGRVGLSDDSGTDPDSCDELVFLARSKDITFSSKNEYAHIPIKDEDGEYSRTIAGLDEALWVAAEFEMEIVSEGKINRRYRVLKSEEAS